VGRTGRTIRIPTRFRIEAALRAHSGRPISAVLRKARSVIAVRGWRPSRAPEGELPSERRIDVLGAIRTAASDHREARLTMTDYYAFLAPIAAVVGVSFASWERRPHLGTSEVLAMLDEAIAFAVRAEGPSIVDAELDADDSTPVRNPGN
jgi:sugar phosphate isomerase/epimerase